MNEKIAILGASSGLGRSTALQISAEEILISSRKQDRLESLKNEIPAKNVTVLGVDYAKPQEQTVLIEHLLEWQPDRVIYCAGGGPHGRFEKKEWKDHQWAFEVCFLLPSRLLHALMQEKSARQIVFVGSHIAECASNSLSPSYGAAKTALRNLIRSINSEKPDIDVRLFSPGYMNTSMLPPNAPPRKEFEMIEPEEAARTLCEWIHSPSEHWHMELPNTRINSL